MDEQEWQAVVRRLIAPAEGVLLVPSHHAGTRWEIGAIREMGLLRRCIFVMPPRKGEGTGTEKHWVDTAASLRGLGINLPRYSRGGLLFTVDDDGNVCNAQPFRLTPEKRLREAATRLLESRPCAFPALPERVLDRLGVTERGSRRKALADRLAFLAAVFAALAALAAVIAAVVAGVLRSRLGM